MRQIIKDDQAFLTASKVKVEEFQKRSFEMHIWPTPEKVEHNLAEAAQNRLSNAGWRKATFGDSSPQIVISKKRPFLNSHSEILQKNSSNFHETQDTVNSINQHSPLIGDPEVIEVDKTKTSGFDRIVS